MSGLIGWWPSLEAMLAGEPPHLGKPPPADPSEGGSMVISAIDSERGIVTLGPVEPCTAPQVSFGKCDSEEP